MRLAVGLIVLAALLRGLVWAVALPAWQGPDEPAHFSYVQRIATTGKIPLFDNAPPDIFSRAIKSSVSRAGFEASRTRAAVRKLRRDMPAFPPDADNLSQRNHGALLVGKYPPAYYLLAAPAYMLPFLQNDTERMYAIRVVSALIGALAVWLVWLLLIEAGASLLIAFLGTLTYSLLPMVSQASANGNPDILLMAVLAGLARSLLVLRRGWTRRSIIAVALWALLALITKPIGGPAAAVMIVGMLGFGTGVRTWWRRGAAIAAMAVVLGGTYIAEAVSQKWSLFGGAGPVSGTRYGLSYLWQFYLPSLPFMDSAHRAYAAFGSLPSWRVWIETGVGFFGWLAVPMPGWTYDLAFWVLVGATCVAIWATIRRRGDDERVLPALLAAAVGNVLLLHMAEVLQLLNGGTLLLQGRYLIPVVPLFAAALYRPLPRAGRVGIATTGALTLPVAVISVQAMVSLLVFFG